MFNKRCSALSACVVSGAALLAGCGANSRGNSSAAADSTNSVVAQTAPSNTNSSSTTTATTTATTTTTTASASDNPMVGQSPGVGAPDIPTTDHDVMDDLQKSWGTGQIAAAVTNDTVGAFRFICRHTNLATDDPTVLPGQPGASHLHDQTGVDGWNASSNYGNLRTGGGGSGCNDVASTDHDPSKSTHSANRTPYWQPALLDGKGNVIVADVTKFYYKRRPASDPAVSDPTNAHYQGRAAPLPNGIKFIFGAFPENSSKAPDAAVIFACTGASNGSDKNNLTFAAAVQCAKDNALYGSQLQVSMSAPDCWDGVNLDSSDHRSHVAYGTYGYWGYLKCDAAHPYVIPDFSYGILYTILPSDDGDIHFSSDEMDNSKPRGWSFHVDYGPAAWDPKVLKMWMDNCIDGFRSCSGGDLGNGLQLKGAQAPIYLVNGVWTPLWRNPQRLVSIPAKSTK